MLSASSEYPVFGDFSPMTQDIHHMVPWAMRTLILSFPWHLITVGWPTTYFLQFHMKLLMAEILIQTITENDKKKKMRMMAS